MSCRIGWMAAACRSGQLLVRVCDHDRGVQVDDDRQILAMAVKAQVTAAPVSCPLPVAREGKPGDRQVPGRWPASPGDA
jgi:hypothetical protein